MKFQTLNRRIHLYLGLVLLPWFFMYGVSAIPFSHSQYFEDRDRATGLPLWTTEFTRVYDPAPPAAGELREWARRMMDDNGQDASTWGAYRAGPNRIDVFLYDFLHSKRLRYEIAEKRLTAEHRRFRFDHFLTGMHARGGFEQDNPLTWAWAVVVDLVCISMLLWVVSGVIMWWNLPATRMWGWLALAGGLMAFLGYVLLA